jgi:hypothetical protein
VLYIRSDRSSTNIYWLQDLSLQENWIGSSKQNPLHMGTGTRKERKKGLVPAASAPPGMIDDSDRAVGRWIHAGHLRN